MRTNSIVVLLLAGILLGACGGSEGGGPPAVGDDEPVLQIISEGGFLPVEMALNTGPRYTLLGDGRLIFQGVQTMEFPGRLVPPYLVARLNENQMAAVIAMVEEIGLPDFVDEVDNSALDFVADAANDIVTYWDENGTHRLSVYALGLEIDEPSERNSAFLELIETFDRFTAEADAEEYVPEMVRVLAGTGFVDPEFQDIRPWPLEGESPSDWQELANGWTCQAFGPEILDAFTDAKQTTQWESPDDPGADPITLLVRPLHPGEADCPGGAL